MRSVGVESLIMRCDGIPCAEAEDRDTANKGDSPRLRDGEGARKVEQITRLVIISDGDGGGRSR